MNYLPSIIGFILGLGFALNITGEDRIDPLKIAFTILATVLISNLSFILFLFIKSFFRGKKKVKKRTYDSVFETKKEA